MIHKFSRQWKYCAKHNRKPTYGSDRGGPQCSIAKVGLGLFVQAGSKAKGLWKVAVPDPVDVGVQAFVPPVQQQH